MRGSLPSGSAFRLLMGSRDLKLSPSTLPQIESGKVERIVAAVAVAAVATLYISKLASMNHKRCIVEL